MLGNYDKMKSPFEWKLTVRNMVAMTIMGVIFFIITLLCEFRFFIKPRYKKKPNNLQFLFIDDIRFLHSFHFC